ncbi:mandelate racemase/muconate lactonizing enzyme family protein [Paraburkholderia sp. BCC1886]|uniref:mandelate racemase/muconate lactonizing enzyme family protein n=1 Tax=Paraburkholderia sp. BCC1886 TaxID=2562670 RepID=UPI0011843888|nr:mandelate racemase/muconate lactonizing enzyme family protein [Paraburkholderia sp. BCC1886]
MPTLTALRTIRLPERPKLIWVELETDDGLTGLGETFRGAQAVEAVLHEQIAPAIVGRDAAHINAIATELMNPYVGFGSSSAEVRAASAVDIALWDLAGQRSGVPVHVALGGAMRASVPVYNTCAGYDFNTSLGGRRSIGTDDRISGPYDDQIAFMRDAGGLAESLLAEGYAAMKIWPFDDFATLSPHQISLANLKTGLEPFRRIRSAVGERIEIMCELHSLWGTQAAARICNALAEYHVLWVEDPIAKMDNIAAVADLRRQTRAPICGGENLAGARRFYDMLAADAVDFVMLDLTWCGGLTEARKIAALAETHGRPLAPHDCTGPVALMAGLQLAIHAPTAIYQEVVRASLATWYADLVDGLPEIHQGAALAPTRPGLGTALRPEVRRRSDAIVRESGRPRGNPHQSH